MSNRLQVLVPEMLDARVGKAAARQRMSKGAWVRMAIEDRLVKEQQVADPLARLSGLQAPTGDIEQMLAEIDSGRSR